MKSEVTIRFGGVEIVGDLNVPENASGLVIFSGGSDNNRRNKRNIYLAQRLSEAGMATMLFGLLTEKEDELNENEFNIELLTDRLVGVTKWCKDNTKISDLKIGYFGTSTGAAAALSAAAYYGTKIKAVVCHDGRPDLTGEELDLVETPTLLIVGGENKQVVDQNRKAYSHMGCEKKMETIIGATHLSEEPGVLPRVAELAVKWFDDHWNR